jgi:hypothetical protein
MVSQFGYERGGNIENYKLIFQLMATIYPLPLLPKTDILHIQNFTIITNQ